MCLLTVFSDELMLSKAPNYENDDHFVQLRITNSQFLLSFNCVYVVKSSLWISVTGKTKIGSKLTFLIFC